MSTKKYEAWVYPTEKNRFSKARKIAGPFESRADALEAAWFDEADEPSPDKRDYFTWEILEVESEGSRQ